MNHRTLTITATIGLLAFTSCSAQQRQIIENLGSDPAPAEVVVTTLVGDPAPQDPCSTGEHEINGVCLPIGTDTPPPTQPPQDPNAPLSCPSGEVKVNDPTPHCVPNPCPAGERWVEGSCLPD